ncbi:MAG: deoxyuridine 5'-triphosphate nucleotidohydrolase [Candidatus Omnitrophica bacterium]|nr:deoxyuridine 5'-triphosphate nucleotidohydrolase [Candidatus Omnitrophota bacterium]
MIFNTKEIEKLIKEKALITDFINLETQLTPNGFDLTVRAIFEFDNAGRLDFSNKERAIPQGKEILPQKERPEDKFGWWNLKKGAYKILTNEIVNLPNDLMAIAFPRSSLLRMGAFCQNAVWDAGFKGRSEFILIVENPFGIKIKQNARLIQLVFISIDKVDKGYSGIYQNNHQK